MKKMATKIIRMASDKKLLNGTNAIGPAAEDYEERLITQQKKITDLTNKVQLLQNQMSASNMKIGSAAPARVPQSNMSNSRRSRENLITVASDNISHQTFIQAQETIRDFQMQRASLEQLLRQTSEQNNLNEQKAFDLQKKLDEQERIFQEQLQQSKLEIATKQRIALQENLELIRVQRELQEKKNSLTMLETQLNQTSTRMQATEAANRELVGTVNRLQQDLQARDMELASLRAALVTSNSYKLKVTTLENQLADCKRENEILAKQTETITASSVTNVSSQPMSSAPLSEIQMFREKLRQTEKAVEILERERRERDGNLTSLSAALSRAQAAEAEVAMLRSQVVDRQSLPHSASLQALCEVVGVDVTDLETALMMLREKKLSNEADVGSKLDLLKLNDQDENSDLQHKVRRAELEHAETIQELEKTRQLLTVQYRINKEYRAEAACATGRLAELKAECEQQLREYARLLDIRAARIHQLETQLNNIAYGTRSYKVSKPTTDELDEAEGDSVFECEEQVALERGDNLLELHLGVLRLTDEAVDVLTRVDPSLAADSGRVASSPEELRLFCTWDFFDFETQATALVQGTSADFNLTVQYPVQMDEFFLTYLHKGRCVIELYQSNNTSFRLLAACCLNLAQLLSGWEGNSTLRSPGLGPQSGGTVARRHAQAEFIGVADSPTASKAQSPGVSGLTGLLVAHLDYYLRLRVPMEQSIRLYLDKAKVLPLLATFAESASLPPTKRLTARDSQETSQTRSGMFMGVNQLVISIVKASGLRSNKPDRLPSAYFVYQFYNLSEYMSPVQQATSAPVFEDIHTVSLRITPELDLYLRTSNLQVYLIDDAETDAAAACLGVASIPLIGLARQDSVVSGAAESTSCDGRIRGLFELQSAREQAATLDGVAEKQGSLGTIEVDLRWLFPYDVKPAAQDISTSQDVQARSRSAKRASVADAAAAVAQALVQSPVDTSDSKASSKTKTEGTKEPSPGESGSDPLQPVAKEARETIRSKIASKRRASSAAVISQSPRLATVPERQVTSAPWQRTVLRPPVKNVLPELAKNDKAIFMFCCLSTNISETDVAKVDNVPAADPDDTEPISLAISEELIDLPSPDQSVSTDLTPKGTIPSPKEPRFKSRRGITSAGSVATGGPGDTAAVPKPRPRSSSSVKSLPDRTPTQSPQTLQGAKIVSPDTSLEPTPRLPREKKDVSGDVSKEPIKSPEKDTAPVDNVQVCVHQLLLKPNAAVIKDSHQVYVEYSFLGLPEPVESPSKPVVVSGKEANTVRRVDFEFSQVFPVDFANNYERRQHLAKMLMKSDPNEGCITLRFVTEPTEDPTSGVSGTTKTTEEECVEYAEAKVDFRRIWKEQRDLLKEVVPGES
nr:unnamed protein product [Spirometra erinaceieuropaei]